MDVAHIKTPFSLEPVRLLSQFFGRQAETRRVLGFLNHGQCVSVVGPAKIGKTSLLFHVAHPYIREHHGLPRNQVFVYLDCNQEWGESRQTLGNFSAAECYLFFREQILQEVKSAGGIASEVGLEIEEVVRAAIAVGGTAHQGLYTLFRTARTYDLKFVIILDHFEVLARNVNLDEIFFASLRSLSNNYLLSYLVASADPLESLEKVRQDGSPFFNIFAQVFLGRMTSEESRQLLTTLLRLANLQCPEYILGYLLELGNNEPYRLQQAGFSAFQVWQEHHGKWHEGDCEEIKARFDRLLAK